MDETFVPHMEPQSIVQLLLKMSDVITLIVHICIVWVTQKILLQNKKFKLDMLQVEEMFWRGNNKCLQEQTQDVKLEVVGHQGLEKWRRILYFHHRPLKNRLNPHKQIWFRRLRQLHRQLNFLL